MDTIKQLINSVEKANNRAEASYWWLKNIDAGQVKELNIQEKIKSVLDLLTKVDHITMDIVISIKNNKQ